MGVVFSSFSMSLDGFIADPDDQVGPLFDWYFNGDVEITPPGYPITFRMSAASAEYWRQNDTEGAFVCGRRLFDYTSGWGGRPPGGSPTFVVTHRPPPAEWPPIPDAPFTFVTEGVDHAVDLARAVAGEGDVGVAGPDIAQQCLNHGLLDEVRFDLVPVFLSRGIRYFDGVDNDAIRLELLQIVEGDGVTHMRYRVTYA